MTKLSEGYNSFVRNMWLDNCAERETYHEPKLSHEEYVRSNHTFLEDKFYTDVAANWVWDAKIQDYRDAQQKKDFISQLHVSTFSKH